MKTNVNTALGDMPDKFYEQSGAARVYQSTPYLNRNYEITSVNPPTSPITLQFFFTDADFTSLQTANPATTMANLNVTRLDNGTCSNVFDATGATATLLTQTANGAANGVRFINVNTPGFSSFFIHANNNPLVIKLGKIAAVNLGNDNRVDWNTVSEEVSDRFELEHSVDGRNFEKIADVKAIGEPSTYSYLDKNAVKGINYYRLKMIDITNEFAYSPVVSAIVKGENVFVVEAFPNPVKDLLYIRTTGTQGMNAQIHITDISGKLLQQKTVNSNATEIDMKPFASGVYFIKYVDDIHSETIRISKQ